jgi:CheY-like chemotaxis protein/anti-sigma regulatory factor (Ser/Thr protein kinase)
VESDAVLLQRIVMNLAHNAVRYTDPGGTVLIAARRRGSAVQIEVWDSGIGISPEHQSEIFKEFYQVGNPGRLRNYGLGLGLNIVERGAQLLGHTVSLRSALGRGTRFCITAPRAAAPIAAPQEPVEHSATALVSMEGKRVLLLEDDDMALEAVTKLLQSWGLQVSTASNIAQASIHLGRGAMPDVIVSDYRLDNGENGLEAIAALRALCAIEVPACLMSGDTDPELMQQAAQAQLTLLHKPVRPAKLRALLRRLLMSDLHGHSTQKN